MRSPFREDVGNLPRLGKAGSLSELEIFPARVRSDFLPEWGSLIGSWGEELLPVRWFLVGGAPGIGKSTLLLQICNCLCRARKVLYVSGEESEQQLKLRAERLNVASDNLYIFSETSLAEILDAVNQTKPDILIVDSIQTLYKEENESSPGSVSQVKDCTMT